MNKILQFFKSIAVFFTGPGARIAETAVRVATVALPIVEAIAKMTPTRTDDEIIALFKSYVVPNMEIYLALPVADRGPALLAAATTELQRRYPSLPIHQVQLAIQMAYTQFKATTK